MDITDTIQITMTRREAKSLEKALSVLHKFMDNQTEPRYGFDLMTQGIVEKMHRDLKGTIE